MVELHNNARRYNNYQRSSYYVLRLDHQLSRAAQEHAEFMARYGRLSHYGYNNARPYERARRHGVYASYIAENLAMGSHSEHEVFQRWMNSHGHRRNIMGSYYKMGVGKAVAHNGTVYWCVMYAR